MTEQEINQVVAELCGWKKQLFKGFDACHEFEKTLSENEHHKFRQELLMITRSKEAFDEFNKNRVICESLRDYISSTALQRCEAFLRVKRKWKD